MMSPRKTLWLSFVRSSRLHIFLKIDVLKNMFFHRKKPVLESLLNKVAGLKVCNFIKKRLKHRCFPVKLHKFSRAPFLQNNASGRVWKGTRLVKILQSCHFKMCIWNQSQMLQKDGLRKIMMNKRDCWNVYRFSCSYYVHWLSRSS